MSQDTAPGPSAPRERAQLDGVNSIDKRLLLDIYLRGGGHASPTRAPAIEKAPPGAPIPLSFEQELIWTHAQLAPEVPLYNEILTVRRTGPLDVAALERALTEVVRRHQAWRTTFDTIDGQPVQIVQPPQPIPLAVVDLSERPAAEGAAEARRLAEAEARRPIDLVGGPILRAKLVRVAPDEHHLYVVIHQIVHDGVSVYSGFFPELIALYEAYAAGRPSPLPEPPVQFADFAHSQRRRHSDAALEPSLAYWRRQLADAPSALELPTDHARTAAQTFRGRQHAFALSKELTEALRALSNREGVTLYVTLLAAFATLLHRYSGQDDISVGTAISTRHHPDVERALGVFLNTIVVRMRPTEGMSFRRLLRVASRVTLEGLSHGDVPFHLLVKELRAKRDPARNPLFQVTFVFEPPMPAPTPGWEMTQMDVDTGVSRVDLYVQMDDRPEGLVGHVRYSADLWAHATIVRLAEHYVTLLESVVADPERTLAAIPMLTAAERRRATAVRPGARLSPAFAPFDRREIEQSLPQRFRKIVAKHGDRTAVRDGRNVWTYAELDAARRKVGCALSGAGPGPHSRVALLLDHDAAMLAAVLGTLSAGRAYVALDPTHPVERLRQIVQDAGAVAVVSSARNLERARALAGEALAVLDIDELLRGSEAPEPAALVPPDALAYILYTSGSTGKPKGVVQSHRNVLHFIAAYTNNLGIGPDDWLTLLPSYAVDAAVMDIFAALLNGATVCPIAVREVGVGGGVERMADLDVTIYHSTPTFFRYVLRELAGRSAPRGVRLVVLGGEEVRRPDVEAHREHFGPGCTLVNGFGPTESTVSLQHFVDASTPILGRSVPIGGPVEATEVSLLSRAGVPGQVYGEIALRSPHVALGYWRDPELTERAFVRDNCSRDRIYKTGDLGRLLPDGTIEYRGRRDLQTKILGFRVELGEIEAALSLHPGVKEAAAVVREGSDGDRQLVAYFVADQDPAPARDELRRFLRGRLPAHMVPPCIVRVERMPCTTSGKLDRLALPTPESAADGAHAPAADDLERRVAAIWASVLRIPTVDVDDDFFELGGHSLIAVQLMARIEAELGVNLPLGTLFEAPTVRRIADVLRPEAGAPHEATENGKAPARGLQRWWSAVQTALGNAGRRKPARKPTPR